jgi:hypothetical protein
MRTILTTIVVTVALATFSTTAFARPAADPVGAQTPPQSAQIPEVAPAPETDSGGGSAIVYVLLAGGLVLVLGAGRIGANALRGVRA